MGAPHSTQPAGFTPSYGHCWQGADVMCYVEDAGAAHPMRYDCARTRAPIPQVYDCGRDDYFNPAPEPGSYLATHWNIYNSAFLAPCAQIAPACGGGWVPEGPAPTPPTGTGAPRVQARRGAARTWPRSREPGATGGSLTFPTAGSATAPAAGGRIGRRPARAVSPTSADRGRACACR